MNHIKTSSQLEEVQDIEDIENEDDEALAEKPLLIEEDYNIRDDESEEEEDEQISSEDSGSEDGEDDEEMELENKSKYCVSSMKILLFCLR